MNKKILIALISLFILQYLNSQTDYDALFKEAIKDSTSDSAAITIPDIPKFNFSINGDNAFEFHIPVTKDHLDFYGKIKSPQFNNDLGVKLSYKTLSVVSEWQFDIMLNEFGSIDNILILRPLENSIKWSAWKFNFGAGFQFYSWGCADKINPTDNLNPRDFTKGLDSEKLSLLSFYTGFFPFGFMSIEAVYVPFEQSDIFPVNWAGKIPKEFFYEQTIISSPSPLIYDVIKLKSNRQQNKLNFDPSSFLLGGKINFNTKIADFSFSYLYDFDPYYTPFIKVKKYQIMFGAIPTGNYSFKVNSVELIRKRLHRFGADFKTTVDRFGLWVELCYTMTEDYSMVLDSIRNHNLSFAAGFDFNYGPNKDFYFNMQMMGEYNPLFDKNFYKDYEDGLPDSDEIDNKDYMKRYYYRAITNDIGTVRSGATLGLSINFKWPVLNSLLTPSISAVYAVPVDYDWQHDARYGSMFLNPELDIMPIDSLHIKIGAHLFFAWHKLEDEEIDIDYNDEIGSFNYHNNIYLLVNYKWSFNWER
ncbi:MAG: hypothetical protein JXB50_08620 [Spirochaetes bacterium]|nr:hypothetical protein [Spirochaetota bacterium]